MARTSNKDRDANEMVMGTFRIKSGIWEDFKRLASQNDATATDLIISFIENCLQTQSIPQSQPLQDIPQTNLDDIYTYIDNKLDKLDIQSRQGIDITNLDKDIDATTKKLIAESLEDGEVGDAIAKVQRKLADENNELQRQIYALEASLEDLKRELLSKIDAISENCSKQSPVTSKQSPVTSPQSPVTSPQSTVPNHQLPVTSEEVINFLGIADILDGEEYWQEQLEIKGIDTKIKDNFEYFKSLGTEFKGVKDTAVSRFNRVLSWLGYKGTKQSTTIKQSDGSGVNKYLAIKVVPQNDN